MSVIRIGERLDGVGGHDEQCVGANNRAGVMTTWAAMRVAIDLTGGLGADEAFRTVTNGDVQVVLVPSQQAAAKVAEIDPGAFAPSIRDEEFERSMGESGDDSGLVFAEEFDFDGSVANRAWCVLRGAGLRVASARRARCGLVLKRRRRDIVSHPGRLLPALVHRFPLTL